MSPLGTGQRLWLQARWRWSLATLLSDPASRGDLGDLKHQALCTILLVVVVMTTLRTPPPVMMLPFHSQMRLTGDLGVPAAARCPLSPLIILFCVPASVPPVPPAPGSC